MITWLAIATGFLILVILLRGVFSGRQVLPQSFSIGFLNIHYYGIIMAVAVLAAYLLAKKRAQEYRIDPKTADDLIFWGIIGGFLGARIYHVLSSYAYYVQYPGEIIKVWNGGLSIFGALLGGIVSLVLVKKILNLKSSVLNYLDWLAPSVLLGQIIGRFGNLFNYEAFGYPTNLPWKMFVPEQFRPEVFLENSFFHPVFLYEVLGNVIILFILLRITKSTRPGLLFFIYLLLYNVLRFFLEFLRIDSTFIYGFRLNAMMSLLLATVSVLALIVIASRKYK